jgi:hypothetical protein
MIIIDVKSRGTESICAQNHIIAEVAFSRPKLWRTRIAGNTESEMRQAYPLGKTIKIPESI